MTNILILGGTGYTGRPLARLLLEHTDARLTLASRHLEKGLALAEALNQHFAGGRVAAVQADAAQAASLRSAFKGHDLVIVASPTTAQAETVIRSALEAGIDYLDVQLGADKFSLLGSMAEEIKQKGRCFITEAGFHPGLPSALVRYAAAHMDRIESADTIGYLNMGHALPYTEAVNELLDVFKNYQAQIYRQGQWTKPEKFILRKFDLGGDIGRKTCYSMFFEELRSLPDLYPSLTEVGFYISESHWVTDWIIMPLCWAWLKLLPRHTEPIGRLLWWGMGTFHNPPDRIELQVRATGSKEGRPIQLRASVAHADGYELTAIPVAACLLQVLDGTARLPGVHLMGQLVEPIRLMKDMERMGATVRTSLVERQNNVAEKAAVKKL